jgi:hypothetical protein
METATSTRTIKITRGFLYVPMQRVAMETPTKLKKEV